MVERSWRWRSWWSGTRRAGAYVVNASVAAAAAAAANAANAANAFLGVPREIGFVVCWKGPVAEGR